MKRYIRLLPILISVLVTVTAWLILQPKAGPVGQVRMDDKGITMLPSTVPVREDLQRRALELLAENASERGIFSYAITSLDHKPPYFYVSVAGLPMDSERMRLADSLWLGVVTIADLPGLPGYVEDALPVIPDASETDNRGYGMGGSPNILPWRDKTTATYGVLGVHDCGFSLNGWLAVDFFPSENMVYSTQGGDVSYVCRDSHQVALRIGENLYTHLEDTGQVIGDHYDQGQALAAMIPGTYDDTCGYADQQPENYHVHFCFIPNQVNRWSADGYSLWVGDGNWYKDGLDPVSTLGTLTADWATAGTDIPGPAAGTNFWDLITGGLIDMFNVATEPLPEHEDMGLADLSVKKTTPVLALLYIFVFSHFNMTIPILVFGIVFLLETVRVFYALYMLVKRLIPVIG